MHPLGQIAIKKNSLVHISNNIKNGCHVLEGSTT
jgi:hypothetical protein